MFNQTIAVCAGFIFSGVTAQALVPTTTNVVSIGAGGHEGNGVAVDTAGNIYVTGQHVTSRYDSSTATRYAELGGVEYVVNNRTDFFLMKFDADLNPLWTRVGGSVEYDFGTAVRVATNGDVVVSGVFQDNFDLGGVMLTNVTSRRADSFVARYDGAGNMLWVETVTGDGGVFIDDVEIDDTGSVYVAGVMYGVATFGGTTVGQNYQSKVFLAKYSGAGQFQWAKPVESSSDSGTAALDIDTNGNVLVGGMLSSSPAGVFLASYDSLGNQNWLSRLETGSGEEISDLAVDDVGNIWFSGRFSGAFDLGNGVALTNAGTFFNGYVAMVDTNRVAQWAVPAGSRGYEFEPDANGNLVVVGYHQAPHLDFAGQPLADGVGGTDLFIGSLSGAGVVDWNFSWASDFGERARAVAIGPDQSILVTGEGNTKIFGPAFSGSVFLAKLSSGGVQMTGPALNILMENGSLEVSWSEAETTFALEAAPSLDGVYGPVPATPVAGKTNTYSIATTNDSLFIRLKENP